MVQKINGLSFDLPKRTRYTISCKRKGAVCGGRESVMESVICHGVAMGGKIYSLRMAKRMTQEQLAAVLNISPAAVSKWERNQSNPSVEMLWALADFFDCSIDELVGRTLAQVERIGVYDDEKFRLAMVGDDLAKCSEISRAEGLLAMEELVPKLQSGSRFLAFAVSYIMDFFIMEQKTFELPFGLLENYAAALPKAEQAEGRMIVAVLRKICAGENTKIIQELIASYIGMEYRERKGGIMQNYTRQEIMDKYKDKKIYSDATNLLEQFVHIGNFEIQTILRNVDNVTLTAALAGASGGVVTVFLANLSDRMKCFISEDMDRWNGTEEEILTAQQRILELGSFCLREE